MKTLAQVLTAFKKPLELQEFDLAPLAPGEVLVKVTAAGVCGSDLHMAGGEDPRTPLPIILPVPPASFCLWTRASNGGMFGCPTASLQPPSE